MTFRTIVEDYFRCDEICPATLNAQVDEIERSELERYRLFRGHLVFADLPGLLPDKNFVNVTVLREPIARLISHYDYIRRTPGDPHYPAVSEMSLEDFTQKLTVGRVGKNIQTYYVAKTLQFNLEKLSGEEVLSIAKASLDRFAFAGILERFQDSLFLLSYIFGWKPILNSRKENAAASKKPAAELSASTLEAIRESSLLDIELYAYAQEIFAQRFGQMCENLQAKYGTGDETASPELIRDRLEKHYEQRCADLQLPALPSLSYDFCSPLWGSGWQRRECPDRGPAYRWTGPDPVSTLDLPLAGDRDLMIELRMICVKAALSEALESFTLEVNGHPLPLTVLYKDVEVRLLQGIIPQAFLASDAPFTRLTLRVNRVAALNAIDPRTSDTRQVGLAFNYLQAFAIELESEKSAALDLCQQEYWSDMVSFVDAHLKPSERIAVSALAFKARFPNVYDYETAFSKPIDFQWAILHKSVTDRIVPITLKLLTSGLHPVFANEVFVVYSNRKELPRLPYTARHVRSIYTTRLKSYLKQNLRSFYVKYLGRKAEL